LDETDWMLSECLDANLVMNVPCTKQPHPLITASISSPLSRTSFVQCHPFRRDEGSSSSAPSLLVEASFQDQLTTTLSTTTPSMCLPKCSTTANREEMTASLNVVFCPYTHCSSMTKTAVDVGRDCQRRKSQSIRTVDRVNIEVGQD
jgi:hypothetical protein